MIDRREALHEAWEQGLQEKLRVQIQGRERGVVRGKLRHTGKETPLLAVVWVL
jgi:hypothetical protein